MSTLWKIGEGTVEDVRRAGPRTKDLAYNTVQTVMNRLAERGLLTRTRRGNAFVYRARYEEADYLARTIGERLSKASPAARKAALVHLVDSLEAGEVDEIARYAARIRRTRRKG